MGLDCVVKYYDTKNNNYSSTLSEDIKNKFNNKYVNHVYGFWITSLEKSKYYISFRGKGYRDTLMLLRGENHNKEIPSLYNDLEGESLKTLYEFLETKCFKHFETEEKYNNLCKKFENKEGYDSEEGYKFEEIKQWIENITDMYIATPQEIKGLIEILKICYDNNLMLYASY
jgi:hypothetical protein